MNHFTEKNEAFEVDTRHHRNSQYVTRNNDQEVKLIYFKLVNNHSILGSKSFTIYVVMISNDYLAPDLLST